MNKLFIINFILFCYLLIVKANDCNFKSKSYCGSTYFGITNINITQTNKKNIFCVKATIFSEQHQCNSEKFNCLTNGRILFSNSSTDCITKLFDQYGMNLPILSYDNNTNVINISESGININLFKC